MPELSAKLSMPYILPSQAQKHVTHNEALVVLDALVQLVLEDVNAETPPPISEEGQVWALGVAPTGVWSGRGGQLAQYENSGWAFYAPKEGWIGWNAAANELVVNDGSTWVSVVRDQNLDGIGIQSSWDAANRLSVSSTASLFSHTGQGHQIKVNKAGVSDTASLLFQTNFSGHAEIGLAGSNNLAIKVSADGNIWSDALVIDGSDGTLSGECVQSTADDTGAGKLARADYVYGPGNLIGPVTETGGTPTGAVIESSATPTGRYTRFADGTQICTHYFATPAATHSWSFPAAFSSAMDLAVCANAVGGTAQIVTVNSGLNATAADFLVWDMNGAAATAEIMVTATGRWF